MINLIIADSELETVPPEMLDDYAIRKMAKQSGKRAGEMLLDSNFMHAAIERHFPGKSTRFGRPDIFYLLLNVAMDSITNRRGHLRVYIHTKHDEIISVDRGVRLPKSYNRFAGLMEDLFRKRKIESGGKELLSIRKGTLKDAVISTGADANIILAPGPGRSRPMEFLSRKGTLNVIIGGFTEGDYASDISEMGEKFSIFEDELTIWTVASEILVSYEILNDL
ncbi:MAG: 16S rRNA methyltransferase [Candidatus Thermoplasmatota archaeon]|jgi:rRNA small subunit pseudouridine methyltransferase Nep1|nr:16S rRNA methyltransferase [Candidatus Thermoplasmatota archaeon]MCL5794070.1 16S rRNA methyltransferase [Candidatus Thermoplasmatota archaeon]